LAPRLRRRELSPADLVEHCLGQIDRLEPAIRAWVFVDRQGARQAARQAADDLAAGRDRGPLHGMPLAIKDIIDVAGWPTRAGSKLTDDRPAIADAPLVASLRAAGAILLGKAVTTEFAWVDPPPTRNPWNHARTPGGSSSGPAAAVASGMCVAAIGSQTGGSITRPATFCGVAGCKPTHGAVPLAGIVPLSPRLDHPGPIARSVADLRILLQVIADTTARSRPGPLTPDPSPARGEGGMRLALVEGYFHDDATSDVWAATLTAVDRLAEAGATVERIVLDADLRRIVALHRRLMSAEAAASHRELFARRGAEFAPSIGALVREGMQVTSDWLAEAIAEQQAFRAAMNDVAQRFDALIMPATLSTAPGTETTGDPRFNSPWSFAGLPTVSLPCSLAPDGLPCGLQLVGRWLGDFPLLDVAQWCERQLAFDAVPAGCEGLA